MAYKTEFQPAQGLIDGVWHTFEKPVRMTPVSRQARSQGAAKDEPQMQHSADTDFI